MTNQQTFRLHLTNEQLHALAEGVQMAFEMTRGSLRQPIHAMLREGVIVGAQGSILQGHLPVRDAGINAFAGLAQGIEDALGAVGARDDVDNLPERAQFKTNMQRLSRALDLIQYPVETDDATYPYAVDLDDESASAVASDIDLLVRLGIGQMRVLTHKVDDGGLRFSRHKADKMLPSMPSDTVRGRVDALVKTMSQMLGFDVNASFGIGHAAVHERTHRLYEIMKVIDEARTRNTNAPATSVHRDGLIVRYTNDPAPYVTSAAPTDAA